MTLSDVAIRRPVFTTVLTLALMVMGVMSIRSLGTDLFPDVTFPVVTITTIYPGASPGEVEQQVTKPLEDSVASVNELDTVRSFSRESVSTVVVLFKLSANIDRAAQEVRERVASVRANLPSEVREPSIRRVDMGATPIRTYVVGSKTMSNEQLRRITEDILKPQVERVAGVAALEVLGGKDREVRVELDRRRLDALNLPLTAVVDKLRAENLNVPAGHFEAGKQEVSVRMSGDLGSAEEVGNIIIATTPSGTQVALKDIADVKDDFAEQRTRIRANGEEAVAFEIIKQSGTNTIEVSDLVGKKLDELAKAHALPDGYKPRLIIDQSTFIRENAEEVEIAIVFGGAMAILIILIFMLDLRSTFISALALPTSVVGTFWIMNLLGFTLNMMTLLALSLAIGLLIDDAVVVRENIFKHLEAGEDPFTAASKGTSEIALAVLATTLTIVAVFMPVAFMSGVVGQFFKQFGMTVSAAVLLSAFVAFTLDPMLSSKLAVKIDHHAKRALPVRALEAVHVAMEEAYGAVLQFSVRQKGLTLLLALGMLVGSFSLMKLMGADFIAPEDRGQFMVDIEIEPGASLEETAKRTQVAEAEMLKNKNIITVYSKLGPNGEVNKVQWRVVANQKNERKENLEDLKAWTRKCLEPVHAKVSITPPAFVEGLPSGAALQIQVRGTDLENLQRDAANIEAMTRKIPGLSDVQVGYSPGRPEQTIRVDRQRAADLGIPVAMVARTLRAALEGEEAGKLRVQSNSSKEVKIRVRLRDEDRLAIQKLLDVQIATPKGFVPLSLLASVEPQAGPQVIERQDRTRQINVTASPTSRSLGEVLKDLEPQLMAYKFHGDGYYKLDGQVKQMRESNDSMGVALLLGVIFIFLILAAQFESFLHPFTIMLALPLALIGAIVGLFLTDRTVSMGAMIGVILLMGLVTKNGILLVDAALQEQRDGVPAMQAVINAGRKRLRPILMTSAAMVLGMLPTAVNNGPGSEFRSPMAIAVIGGVLTSTFLTLIVLPSVFLWFDSLRALPGKLFGTKTPMKAPSYEPIPGVTVQIEPAMAVASREAIPPAQLIDPRATQVGYDPQDFGKFIVVLLAGALLLAPTRADAQVLVAQAPTPTVANDTPPPANAVRLEDAIRAALEGNGDIAVAQARLAEAEAQKQKIYTAWMPDVKVIGGYTHNSAEAVLDFGAIVGGIVGGIAKSLNLPLSADSLGALPPPTYIQKYDTVNATLTVDQTIFALSPILAADAADKGLDAQRTGVEAAKNEIAYQLTNVWLNYFGLERLIAAAERAVDLSDKRIAVAKVRKGQGTEAELPLLRAQVERNRAEQDLLKARQAQKQLLHIISILTHQPVPEALVQSTPAPMVTGTLHDWVDAARAHRPDLQARKQAVLAAQAMVREAELRWVPILAGNGVVRASDTKGFTGDFVIWQLNLNLVVPLFDRGLRYAELKERRATVARLQQEADKVDAELENNVRQAALDIESARDALRLAQAQAQIARRSADITSKAYAAGAVTSLELAEVDTNRRLADANEERERIGLEMAELKLRHLTGAVRY